MSHLEALNERPFVESPASSSAHALTDLNGPDRSNGMNWSRRERFQSEANSLEHVHK